MTARSRTHTRAAAAAWEPLALAVLALASSLASVMYLYPVKVLQSYDPSAYIFVADGVLKGRVPYVQLWENKGLPLYAFSMLGRLMTPGHYTGIWLLEFAFTTLAFWCVVWTVRRFASIGATIVASGLLVLGIVMTAVGGNTPEFWNLPLQASGLVAGWLLVSGEWRANRWLFAVTGFAAGVAGMMKISLLGTWIAVFCLLVALAVARRVAFRDALRLVGLMAAGFSVAVALSVAPIVACGATRAWWDEWIVFGMNMTKHGFGGSRLSGVAAAQVGLGRVLFISATLVAAMIAAPIGWLARRRPRIEPKRLWMAAFLFGWLLIEVWASSVNGLPYWHYVMPWLIPSVALIGLLLGGKTSGWLAFALAGLAIAVGLWHTAPEFQGRLDFHKGFPPVLYHESPLRRAAWDRMILEVRQRTKPSDTVLVWGMDPVVFTETGRLSAGPYGHPLDILLAPGYESQARFGAFMRDLEAHPPQLIIDSAHVRPNQPSIPELDVAAPVDTAVGRVQPYMHALPDFLKARYRYVGRTKGLDVEFYELIGK